ncbi:alpha/beta fold hydrolase [Streptomyces sp. NPDC059979]|uniref:alpha/beta fold hydrolase n=1 Tax=Streptomyces sp. NPDC059979 TaxID=3347021 RepID=UPI00369D7475
MTDHHHLTVNGVRLAYRAAGPEEGDPLVLLPALGEGADDRALVRDALARERRVYALDLRGHGRSARTAEYSLELMRDDVLGFLDALGLDRADLVGRAAGAVVAHLVAQAAPHRVVRLVLEDVPAPLPREPVEPLAPAAPAAPVRPDGDLDVGRDAVLAVGRQLDRPDPAWLEGLGRITAPTLVVVGGQAGHVPQDGVAELVRRIPDARMTTIPVGHLVHAAAPEAFVREVAAFLDGVPDGLPHGVPDSSPEGLPHSAPDDVPDSELARRWLAAEGVTRTGEDEWTDGGSEDGRLTSNEVAHAFAGAALRDESLDVEGRLRLGFGLVDLLNEYWVTSEIRSAVQDAEDPRAPRALWDGYRSRLEAPEVSEALTYSLWVDWFEDHDTAGTAFAEVLGKDVGRLRPGAPEPLLRRARRVLECSGPVPWQAKAPVYRSAALVPALHDALFRAVLSGYHDVYGDLDPGQALGLLGGLEIPADTEHLAALRRVLTDGHSHHYASPQAWDAALDR